ncbi:PQQ-like beta-propeller repeat protein [Ehrlichia sp. JZT12]
MIKLSVVFLLVLILCFPAIALADDVMETHDDQSVQLSDDFDITYSEDIDTHSKQLINKSIISLKMYKGVIPAFADGKIVFLSRDGVLCSVSGQNLTEYYWKLDITKGAKLYRASILYSENMVLYAANDNVYGIDFNTGEIKWQKSLRSVIAGSPIVVNNNLVVVTVDNFLYSFNIANGALSWSIQESLPEVKSYNSLSSTSYGEVVIVSFSNGKIVALNSLNGLKMWEADISSNIVNSIPFNNGVSLQSTEGTVIVVDKLHNISNIDIESGKTRWSKNLRVQNVSQIEGTDIIGIIDGKLTLLNISTGEFLWQYDLLRHGKSKIQWSTPIVKDGHVFIISSDGCVVVVDSKSGDLKLVNYILSSSYYVPIFVNSSVYFVTNKNKIIVFH